MTNDEAIEIIECGDISNRWGKDGEEVEGMAIKALEQQPCDDCISRAYIEPIIEELENICVNGDEHILDLLADIKNAPPVTPQPKTDWIHVFERMPKDGQNVLFCDIDEDIMIGYHVKGEPDTHFM